MANNIILEKLEAIKVRYEEIGQQIAAPEAMGDMKRYVKLNKEYRDLEPLIDIYDKYRNVLSNLDEARNMLQNEKDEELREMAREEVETLSQQVEPLEEQIKLLLLPSDPEDDKNAVMEIRAGTGGDEASIFAGDLYRMYSRYCEIK